MNNYQCSGVFRVQATGRRFFSVVVISALLFFIETVSAQQGSIGIDQQTGGSANAIFTARYEVNPDGSQGVVWGANIVGLISGASLASNALEFGISKIQDYAVQKGIQIAMSPLLQHEREVRFINVGFVIRGDGTDPTTSDLILLREYNDDPNPVPLGVPVHLGYTLHHHEQDGPRIVSKRHVSALPVSNHNYLYRTVHEIGHLSESFFSHDVYFQTTGVVNAYRTQNQTDYLILSHYPGISWFGSMSSNKFIAIPLDHHHFQLQVPSIGSVVHITGKTQSPGQDDRRVYFENDHSHDLSVIKTIEVHDYSLKSGSFIPIQKIPTDTRLFHFSLEPSGSWTVIIDLPESNTKTVNNYTPHAGNQMLLNIPYMGPGTRQYTFFERDGRLISQSREGEVTPTGYSYGLSKMHPYETHFNQYLVLWGSVHGRSSEHFEFGVDSNGIHFVDVTYDMGGTDRYVAVTNHRGTVCNTKSAAELASSYFSPVCSIDPATYSPFASLDLNRSGRKAFIFQSCAGPETRGRFTFLIIEKRVECTNVGTITTYSPNPVFEINYNNVDNLTSHARGYTYHAVVAGDIHVEESGQIMVFEFDVDSQRYRFRSLISD